MSSSCCDRDVSKQCNDAAFSEQQKATARDIIRSTGQPQDQQKLVSKQLAEARVHLEHAKIDGRQVSNGTVTQINRTAPYSMPCEHCASARHVCVAISNISTGALGP